MKLHVIASNYPTPFVPESGAFTHAAVQVMVEMGNEVHVIAPSPALKSLAWRLLGRKRRNLLDSAQTVNRPTYLSISSRVLPWRSSGHRLTALNYGRVVDRQLASLREVPDCVYGHFFFSGYAALSYCRRNEVRLVVNMGESTLERISAVYGDKGYRDALGSFSGIVAVSEEIRENVLEMCPVLGERVIHLPNAINLREFHPRDRKNARRKLALPEDACIAAFCGHFIERKGPLRVLEAINALEGSVKGVFLGQGPQLPKGPHVLRNSSVPHDELPEWLAAADIFVLPSLAEGMCNAILEAMATGLPVVVSDRTFNTSFLDQSCAFLVDPKSVASIANALAGLRDNLEMRRRLGEAALRRSRNHCLHRRVERILDFMKRLSPVERVCH